MKKNIHQLKITLSLSPHVILYFQTTVILLRNTSTIVELERGGDYLIQSWTSKSSEDRAGGACDVNCASY